MAKINGKIEKLNDINLIDYLEENNYKIDRVAVEYNGNIIKKSEFKKITIKDEDKIEILCFVGGG